MAFTLTDMTYEQRKMQIDRLQIYLDQLKAINAKANELSKELTAAGQSGAEVSSTCNKVLSAGGPPFITAATDLTACTGDTVSDRMVNLLTSYTGGTGWTLTAPI